MALMFLVKNLGRYFQCISDKRHLLMCAFCKILYFAPIARLKVLRTSLEVLEQSQLHVMAPLGNMIITPLI